MTGVNLYPWGFDRSTDAKFSPAYLRGLVDTGFRRARIPYDVTPVLSGGEPSSALGWYAIQDATRCLAAGFEQVVVCLAPKEGTAYGADAICADAANLRAYRVQAREIVHRLQAANVPSVVSVELMNEPQLWGSGGDAYATRRSWGPIQHQVYQDCRAQDPTRPLLLTGPCSSWAFGLPYFDPSPYVADPLVSFSYHWYGLGDGISFSHQGAPWVQSTANLHDVPWPSQQPRVQADMARFTDWGDEHGIDPACIVLTEFGVFRSNSGIGAALPDAARFLSNARASAEALGMPWYVYAETPGAFAANGTAFSLTETSGSGRLEPCLLEALGLPSA